MLHLKAFLHPFAQRARNLLFTLTYALARRFRPLRPDSVALVSTRSPVLSDNLLYLYNGLDKQKYSITTFFFANRPRIALGRLRPNLAFIWAMAQTQYTIIDDFFPLVYPARLRPGAKLVQVWHALGALKRVGYSRGGHHGGPPSTSLAHKNYTDVIVSSDGVRQNYAEAFGVPLDIVHATGVPRTDLFFDQAACAEIRADLYRRLPILRDRRVILFAPTFRGIEKKTAHYPANFLDLDRLGAALDDDDLFVIKMHPFVKQAPVIPPAWRDRIIDLTDFPEFNHLLLVTDLLITDYSSAIFDYALLGRPALFYVPDLDTYDATRGFYYDFSQYTYGPVTQTFDGLLAALHTTAVDQTRLAQFRRKFLNRCDGQATQRCLEAILGQSFASSRLS